jgi:UDP-N-acetylmuramoyl-tripeptide--D-alanyl-D-alanine ligase
VTDALWTWSSLIEATRTAGAIADGAPTVPITGFAIDTRALSPGDVFVALKDQRDGHEFVPTAFAGGASAAIVESRYQRQPGDGPLLRAPNSLQALEEIGRAARARLAMDARVVAVTGSVGKTGTKEMLRACLSRIGPTHAPEKSFNNHWGVPLTLARMAASVRYGVFEIGMNHAGEISPLTRLVRPHAAIITTVEAVHLRHFGSVEEIADAKAEILEGVEPGGTAILNRDNAYFERIAAKAAALNLRVVSFGRRAEADVRPEHIDIGPDGTTMTARLGRRLLPVRIAAPGAHIAMNALAVAAAIDCIGGDAPAALAALASLPAPAGRGAREALPFDGGTVLLIDEAYNANPASMRAALAALALVPRGDYPRRIAVLGDMLELGERSRDLHAGLIDAVDQAGVDLVFAAGRDMQSLYERLTPSQRGSWSAQSCGIEAELIQSLKAGDAVMIKGSLGSRMGLLVEALRRTAWQRAQ